jgi:uncharacterized beta barrel domain-containing protein DUF5777
MKASTAKRRLCWVLWSLPVVAGASAAHAWQGSPPVDPYRPLVQDAVGSRLINAPTPFTFGRRGLEVLFTHRFSQSVQDGSGHDLWGLDSGADTGIGLALGATANLDFELYRSSFQETYELAVKFQALRQAERVPLSIAVRAGGDFLQAPGTPDAERPFGQLLLARQLRPGWSLFAAPSYVRATPRLRNAFNVPLGATVPLGRRALLELEVVPANGDLPGSEAAWHVAISKSVGTHIFEFTLGNSRATSVDQMMGSDFAGRFESGDLRLGFNLVRGFVF